MYKFQLTQGTCYIKRTITKCTCGIRSFRKVLMFQWKKSNKGCKELCLQKKRKKKGIQIEYYRELKELWDVQRPIFADS